MIHKLKNMWKEKVFVYFKVPSRIYSRKTEVNYERPTRRAGISAEIRRVHLWNASQKRYSQSHFFGVHLFLHFEMHAELKSRVQTEYTVCVCVYNNTYVCACMCARNSKESVVCWVRIYRMKLFHKTHRFLIPQTTINKCYSWTKLKQNLQVHLHSLYPVRMPSL
jgi:hypothetical protein